MWAVVTGGSECGQWWWWWWWMFVLSCFVFIFIFIFLNVFIIILMIYLCYFNEIAKNGALLLWGACRVRKINKMTFGSVKWLYVFAPLILLKLCPAHSLVTMLQLLA